VPTITEQSTTLQQQRQAAEVALQKAQQATAAAKAVVSELETKLEAEKSFRQRLVEQFDAAAIDEQEERAASVGSEIAKSNIKLRGLELRLQTATEQVSAYQQAEAPLHAAYEKILLAEEIAAERVELGRMIDHAQGCYDKVIKSGEALEQSLAALESKSWADAGHKSAAADSLFRLRSRLRGFNY
jgi:hypothetical protein